MEIKKFKQIIAAFATRYGGKRIDKKHVWRYNELVIILDTQRSEFQKNSYYINVSYFIVDLSGIPDLERTEYLGDVVYRFNASKDDNEHSDVFVIHANVDELSINRILEREFMVLIEGVNTISELKDLISNKKDSKPFMKIATEKYLGFYTEKKKGYFRHFIDQFLHRKKNNSTTD